MKKIIAITILLSLFIAGSLFSETELIEKRTFFTKTYHIEGNNYKIKYSTIPLHYLDDKDEFKEIPIEGSGRESLISLAIEQCLNMKDVYNYFPSIGAYVEGSYLENDTLLVTIYEDDIDKIIGETNFGYPDYLSAFHRLYANFENINLPENATFNFIDLNIDFMTSFSDADELTVRMKNGFEYTQSPDETDYNGLASGTQLFETLTNNDVTKSYSSGDPLFDSFTSLSYYDNLGITLVKNNEDVDEIYADVLFITIDLYYEYNPVTISGYVRNESFVGISNVLMSFSNGGGTVTTNQNGYYTNELDHGWSDTVTPEKTSYVFNPDYRTYSNVTSNQTNKNYTAYEPVSISGYVEDMSENGIPGVTMNFSNGGGTVTTNQSGYYTNDVTYGWSGSVTPGKAGYVFEPEDSTYSNVTSDQTNQNYTGIMLGSIEGTITISGGGDNTRSVTDIVIRAGEYETNPDTNGDYSLDIPEGTYDVYAIVPGYGIEHEDDVEVTSSSPTTVDFSLSYSGYIIINQDGIAHFSDLSGTGYAKNNETVVIYDGYYEDDMMFLPDTTSVTITVRGLGQSYTDDTIINGKILVFGVDDFELNINYLTFDGEDELETTFDTDFLSMGSGTITLYGNIIQNYTRHGIEIPDYCPYYFEIMENIIKDCDIDAYSYPGTDVLYGAGIYCESSSLIKNNIIRSNNITFDGYNYSCGGGIYVSLSADSECVIIEDNQIYGNSAYEGGAIFCEGDGTLEITGNKIYENTVSGLGLNSGDCVGICSDHYDGDLAISYNCIYENIENYCSYVIFLDHNQSTIVYNNTITHNDELTGIRLDGGMISLQNNIITENEYGISQYGCNETIEYCNVYNNGTNYSNCSAGTGCISADPLYADSVTYSLAWNDTLFSPCIDTGHPWEQYNDADGTPSDMGAVTAVAHEYFKDDYDEYSFDNIDWISFPVLNRTTDGWMDALDVLERQYLINDNYVSDDDSLNYVLYKNVQKVYFSGNSWINDLLPDGDFDSMQGYKFVLKEGCDYMPVQGISGTWLDPSTPIQLYPNQFNWVGCFLEEPMSVEDAFESIADEWLTIRSEHWAVRKGHKIPPSWTANPGELYIITVDTPCQLVWDESSGGGIMKAFVKEETDYFTYTETIDYMAINIDTVYSDTSVTEIGVYSGDECLGATKVYDDEYPVQILAYTPEETKGSNPLEFMIYYEGLKGDETKSIPYITYSIETQAFSTQPLSYTRNDFARIQLNREGSSMIHKLTLLQNYPNPVRTNITIIRFMQEQNAAHTELNIYNIRGQLVRTIDCDGIISSGTKDVYYSISWDCKDRYGKDIENGIYFYKLTSGNKRAVQKMLLMK